MNSKAEEAGFRICCYLGNKMDISKRMGAILLGDFICAFAMTFFFQQKGLLSGGLGGIGLLLKFLYNIPTGLTILILNIPLVIMGYIFLNKIFTTYAMISAVILSGILLIFENFKNPFILEDAFLVSVIGGAINGIGMGILFRYGACQGGLDILAAIFKKRLNMNIGNALLGMNMLIVLTASYIFSLDKGLYTIVSMVVGYTLLDRIQMGFGERKQIFIISKEYNAITEDIIKYVHRGVTYLDGSGAYSETGYKIIYTVVGTRQIAALKQIVEEHDKNAFMTISDTYEVKGKGFKTAEI